MKKSLLQYENACQAPKFDFIPKEITVEDAVEGAITRDILNSIFPPVKFEQNGEILIKYVSLLPATRTDVVKVQTQLDKELKLHNALDTGACPIRSMLYSQCFDEIIRQITIDCSPRGILLVRLRNEIQRTIDEYKKVYESSLKWGILKESKEANYRHSLNQENHLLREEIEQLKLQNAQLENLIAEKKRNFELEVESVNKNQEIEIQKMKEEINSIRNQIRIMMVTK